MNYDYPEASYERRAEILEEHQQYQKGLMYFLAADPRVPPDVQQEFAKWGYAKDEFTDHGGWPHQIYVRESRRMIGDYVMTEHDVLDLKETPEPIGMGSYTMDSHNTQRYVTPEGFVQNEGDLGVKIPRPYEISYRSLIPPAGQAENLLVPVCLSSSHIAFGSIRMEPVFMILGHSAAAAACIALDREIPVQQVAYRQLREQLVAEGQIVDLPQLQKVMLGSLPGIVVDDSHASLQGAWKKSTASQPYIGFGYLHDDDRAKGELQATFAVELKPGRYQLRIAFPAGSNRATNAKVVIKHAAGSQELTLNQRQPKQLANQWVELGEFNFDRQAEVIIANRDTDGHVILDAVQWLPAN
jgi:hypothetical protein